jgi:hypothetical protein
MQKPIRSTSLVLASAALAALAAGTSPARADNTLDGPWSVSAPQYSFVLAQGPATDRAAAEAPATGSPRKAQAGEPADAAWYGRNSVHKYLGLGSLAAAALTIVTPKEKGGAHENLAEAAAALGVAAVATGGYAHWNDIDFSWSDPDTKHALFGTLGTLGFLLAVAKGGEGGHAAAGALGAVSMAVGIKYTW